MSSLVAFDVKNYRSCVATKALFPNQLTTLVGINGAGKTNFLNALLLLRQLIIEPRRFTLNQEASLPADPVQISAVFDIEDERVGLRSKLWFDPSEERDLIVHSETKVRDLAVKRSKWELADINVTGSRYWYVSATRNRIIRRHNEALSPRLRRLLDPLSEFISKIRYYSATQFANPTLCPLSIELEDGPQTPRRVVSVDHERYLYDLHALWQSDTAGFQRYISIIGQEGLALVDKIEFTSYVVPSESIKVRPGGDVQKQRRQRTWIVPSFYVDGLQLSPNQLSEGTFKTLALLFYILNSDTSLLLIEEPEVCVHHGLLDSIIELLIVQATRKQVILSTHSDFVLDRMAPENVQIVTKRDKGTVITPVSSALGRSDFKALKEYLQSTGNLGDYWKEGGFDSGEG